MDFSPSAVLATAQADHDSVTSLIQELVAIPSRGGIDPYQPVLDHVDEWFTSRQLEHRVLLDEADGSPVGIICEIIGDQPGPRWVLDACLDTAGYGNVDAWTHHPATPVIAGDWMWGRGTADSKAGAAIFAHIAARLSQATDTMHGSLVLLLDVDEHTGRFGGARRYFEGSDAPSDIAGVMIGYPGIDHVIVGGRGIHRSRLHVSGVSSHSGGRHRTPNAIEKAAHLVHAVSSVPLPGPTAVAFPEPRLTVTGIEGGRDYSATPDECIVDVDIRTTPVFDCHAAESMLKAVVQDVDESWPGTRPTIIRIETQWPPYALAENSPLRDALLESARNVGARPAPKIAGPSNIGNYLAGLGIPATAGFGVDYTGLHATDERIRLSSIPAVQAAYHAAVMTLLVPKLPDEI